MIRTVAYSSPDAPTPAKWIVCLFSGDDMLPVRFTGPMKDVTVAKAEAWIAEGVAKEKRTAADREERAAKKRARA
jgi:hypothetical protein